MSKKVGLKDLKIQSFVTSLSDKQSVELKGGKKWESCPSCPAECPSANCTIVEYCSGYTYTCDTGCM